MNLLEQYMQRSQDIIGERTPGEKKYDNEVVKFLKKYGKIRKALNAANKKYPSEALQYNNQNIGDLESRYSYLMEHSEIAKKIGH